MNNSSQKCICKYFYNRTSELNVSTLCHIYASVNLVVIGTSNGLSPARCQAITCTNTDLLSIVPLGTNFSGIRIKIHVQNVWFDKSASENVVCEMVDILSTERWVKKLRLRQNGFHFADDRFKCIFLNDNAWISIEISVRSIPKGPITIFHHWFR